MSKIDIERLRIKRGPGRPPSGDPMPQISIRVPQSMLDRIDAVIEHERYGQGDRATIIREAVAAYLEGGAK
jgi:metal-responsive CopG/Arc/MetJ family transcriptional regulator